jgi:transcriptional regulator with XRE-family HTH domain
MSDRKIITGAQIRAARAFLRWSAQDLADASKVGVATVRRAEKTDGVPRMIVNNMEAIQRAFETAGIAFTNGGEPGVKMAEDRDRQIDK